MDLNWTPTQKKLFDEFYAFGKEVVAPRAAEHNQGHGFDHESWLQLTEKTDFWLSILPSRFSGREVDWWDFSASLEGLASGAGDGGFILTAVAQAGVIRGLTQIGNPTQQEKYFPMLRRGALTATCIAEPHSGTDMRSFRTAASGEAGDWKLSGEKWNISHAPTAEIMLVVGRIPALGKRDITLFVLDAEHPNIERGPAQQKLGNRSIPTSWLKFNEVPLDDSAILGMAGDGFRALAPIVAIDRVYYGWMGACLIQPILEKARNFIQDRESMRKPLQDHQYAQQKIVETLISLQQARWTGMGALSEVLSEHPKAAMSSSIAKLSGTRSLLQSSRDLLSLFGSNGYQDSEISRLAADALGFLSVGGTEESHKINIFNQWKQGTGRLLD